MPDNQFLGGFTVNPGNDTFSVPVSGSYLINYSVNLETPADLSSRIVVNGVPLAGSIISPASPQSHYTDTLIVPLNAGDTIQLQLYDLDGTVTLLENTGASLQAARLS